MYLRDHTISPPDHFLEIKIKKTHPDAFIPKKAHNSDAAFDLVAVSRKFNHENDYYEYDTGLAFETPVGWAGFIFPRSSISNYPLILCNSVGVLDAGFRNSVKLRFLQTYRSSKIYEVGDKIGQIIFMPIPEVKFIETDDLSESERGIGGFGSSGV